MTENEIDLFLKKTLNDCLSELKECVEHEKKSSHTDKEDIIEEFTDVIKSFNKAVSDVETLEDLADIEDEDFENIVEYLLSYEESFVISADEKQQEIDLSEYEKLQQLLDIFYGDDEEYEEDIDE